jgi:hypothetical protein
MSQYVLKAERVVLNDGTTIDNAMVIPQDLTVLVVEEDAVTEYSRDAILSIRYVDDKAQFYLKGIGMVNLMAEVDDMREDLEEFQFQLVSAARYFEEELQKAVDPDGAESAHSQTGGSPYEVGA